MTTIKMPAAGDRAAPAHPSEEMLRILAERRSTSAAMLADPGPDNAQLDLILQLAARVPDHRKLVPFRFIVFDGEGRERIGDAVIAAARAGNAKQDKLSDDQLRSLFLRAPTVVAVISSVDPAHKTPVWEQELCCGAVCYNVLLASHASGFAGQWLTEWLAFDQNFHQSLGLGANERIAGFIYLGTAIDAPIERDRPAVSDIVTRY
ncbi:nitroreductase [Parvularcula sp. LCG005]|uniref:nitroreductase family protein n=1 Tax=Parvularcula sp. LCG005 TaxID=3078805 RepID=UPI0029439610|nr:nitroreductase [Parvularcula sp. LCG005]WOI52117.1 nitroreductase [Parvularcula sp. LCG005]